MEKREGMNQRKLKIRRKNNFMVKYSDDKKNRDLNIVKTCDQCGEKYHPRNNSYQVTSRFCSAECMRKGRKNPKFKDD